MFGSTTLLLVDSVSRGRVQDPLHECQALGSGGRQTGAEHISPTIVPQQAYEYDSPYNANINVIPKKEYINWGTTEQLKCTDEQLKG